MLRRRLIGVAVLAAAVAGAWLGIAKPDPFAHRQVVHVMFDRVQGIALVQRDVRVAGVNVGSIGAVHRVGEHAEVDLILHQHIPIYRNATAALRPHTPFEGTTFVDLNPGTPGAGPLGDTPIPRSQSTVFVSAGDVLSTFTTPVRQSFQGIVHELVSALAPEGRTGLSTAIHNAPALVHQTATVAPAIRGPHGTDLRSLIPSVASTVDALAGTDHQLRSAIHNASRTLDAVAVEDGAAFDSSLRALPGALAQVTTAGHRLVSVLQDADAAGIALVPTLRAIPPTTAALTPLLERAQDPFAKVPPVINDFAQTLVDLGHYGPDLGRLFATLRAPASLLRYSLEPFLDSRSALGLPVYLQLMAATTGFTGVLSSFVTRAQTALATGHALRGTLQGPLTLPLGALNSPLPCSAIAKLNAQAAMVLEELGVCTP